MIVRIRGDQVVASECIEAKRRGGTYFFVGDQRLPAGFDLLSDDSVREALIEAGVSYVHCNDGAVEVFADYRGWNHIYLYRQPEEPPQFIISDSPFAFAGYCPIDWDTLKLVPLLRFVPLPLSPIKGTTRLSPGQRVVFDRPTLAQTESESVLPALLKAHDATSRLHIGKQIRQTLLTATAARAPQTRSPVVFLSGGLDSSLLVNLLQSIGTEPVAWTAEFSSHLGELENLRAGAAARHFSIPWTQVPVQATEVSEHLQGIIDAMHEPFADVATLAEAVLACQVAGEHEDPFVFEGEGMDSLMCGSYKFVAERYRRFLLPLLTLFPSGLLGREDRSSRIGSLGLKLRQLKEVLQGGAAVDRHFRFLFNESEAIELEPEIETSVRDVFRWYYELLPEADTLTRLACMTFFGIIPNLENRKLRLIERYAGVNFELVYQDIDFVRLAFSLSGRRKVSWGYGKRAVRKAFANDLPQAVTGRAKLSFVFPVLDYLSDGELHDMSRSRLIDQESITRVIDEHRSGRADHLAFLWGLRVADGWAKRYEEAAARASSSDIGVDYR